MVAHEKLIGVFNVESPLPDAFHEEDIVPLMTLAGQAAIAIENARLYDNLRSVSVITSYSIHYTKLYDQGVCQYPDSLDQVIEKLPLQRHRRPRLAGGVAFFRITSYNVCYTKLLRHPRYPLILSTSDS